MALGGNVGAEDATILGWMMTSNASGDDIHKALIRVTAIDFAELANGNMLCLLIHKTISARGVAVRWCLLHTPVAALPSVQFRADNLTGWSCER